MSDTEELSQEDQYEKDLLDAGKLEAKAAEEVADDAPEPVADIATPEKPEVEETAAEVAEAEEFFPGYKDLSDEAKAFVRAKMEAANKADEYAHRLRQVENDKNAIQGRLAPIQREYENLKAKVAEAETKQTSASRSTAKAALEKFQRDYPDEAEALLAVNSQFEDYAKRTDEEKSELLERVNKLTEVVERQQKAAEWEHVYNTELQKLKTIHPDYAEIDVDPEYKLWLKAIEPTKRAFLYENRTNAEVVSSFLSDFKRDRDYARLLQAQGEPATPNTPASRPLARTVADPNPTARRTTAIPRSNSSAGLDGEEKYLAELREAGIDV